MHTVSGAVTKEKLKGHIDKNNYGVQQQLSQMKRQARTWRSKNWLSSGLPGSCTNGLKGHDYISARPRRKRDIHLNVTGGKTLKG